MAHNWITNLNSLFPLEYSNLIHDCRSLLERPWVVKTDHIWREANGCANLLAKKGVDQFEREIFSDTCTVFVMQCYFWDSLGFTSPRLVGCIYQGSWNLAIGSLYVCVLGPFFLLCLSCYCILIVVVLLYSLMCLWRWLSSHDVLLFSLMCL